MTGREEFERMSKSLSRDDRRGRSTPPPLAEPLAPLVNLLRQLLETAGAEAEAFIGDWPRELVARPVVARSLPVVAALPGLSRFAAPGTRALVEGIAALAGELDWRQTYTEADFGQRFLDNYGWSEWIGERGAFVSGKIACGVLMLGPDTEYPAHSHEAEELYLPLAGCALWRAGASDWRLRGAGRTDSSSLMDGPRHAHRARAAACGLCMARGRPQRQIAHRPPLFRSGEGDAH